ncbi:MAG: MBL fold metallo-hydrolase [Planctomycetota bacterium]|nr:MBL fold metallo-hydrolase [Planctomycetota bacterium]
MNRKQKSRTKHSRRKAKQSGEPHKRRKAVPRAALRFGRASEEPLGLDVLVRLEPFGAVGGVTGSSLLITTAKSRVLIDAGMFQGGRWSDEANRMDLPLNPAELDAVVLTHAHIDHSGLLPRYCSSSSRRERLDAKVHASRATAELLPIMLRDAAHIQEVDAEHDSRRAIRRGENPVAPLYTGEDAERVLEHVVPHDFDEEVQVAEDVRVRFRRAGHIIGAASLEVTVTAGDQERRIAFSGDLGRKDAPLVCNPVPPHFDHGDPHVVICESTYGNREHKSHGDTHAELLRILEQAKETGGTVLIPVFAVGRAQEILLALKRAFAERPELGRPVVLDSPMAISVTELYSRHAACFAAGFEGNDAAATDGFEPAKLEFSRHREQSMALNRRRGIVILSASGMCDAGRIRHHLKHRLWQPQDQVVIVGYQAHGSLGRRLVEGAPFVRLMGEEISVRAGIHTLGGYSAHAGQGSLLAWIDAVRGPATQVVLNHGEDEARTALASELLIRSGVHAWLPTAQDRIELPTGDGPPRFVHPPEPTPQ